MKVKSESEVAQSCPTLSDPIDYSPPGSSVHGIFQARVLEWGAIAFSASNATEVQSLLSSLKKVCQKKKKKKKREAFVKRSCHFPLGTVTSGVGQECLFPSEQVCYCFSILINTIWEGWIFSGLQPGQWKNPLPWAPFLVHRAVFCSFLLGFPNPRGGPRRDVQDG